MGYLFLALSFFHFYLCFQTLVSFLITFLLIMKIVCACCENWKMQNKYEDIFHDLTFQLHFDVPILLQGFSPRICQHTVYTTLSFPLNVT